MPTKHRKPNRRSRKRSTSMQRLDNDHSEGRLDILMLGVLDRIGREISANLGLPILYDTIRPQVAEVVEGILPNEPLRIPREVLDMQGEMLGIGTVPDGYIEGYVPSLDDYQEYQGYIYSVNNPGMPPPPEYKKPKKTRPKKSKATKIEDRPSDPNIVDAEFVDLPDQT